MCEIQRNSPKIQTYSSSRSSKFIDLDVNRKLICNFQLVINSSLTMDVSLTVFGDIDAFSSKIASPSLPCLTPPSGGAPCDINVIYTPLKSTLNGLQFRRGHYGSIFIHVAVVHPKVAKSCEISTKFDLTAVQGHPRSSILVSIESSYATSY